MHLTRPVSFYRKVEFYFGLVFTYGALMGIFTSQNLYSVGLSIPVLILGGFEILQAFVDFPLINVQAASAVQRATWLLPTAVGLLFLVLGQIGRIQQHPRWALITYVGAVGLCSYAAILTSLGLRTTAQRQLAPDDLPTKFFWGYLVLLMIVSAVTLISLFLKQ